MGGADSKNERAEEEREAAKRREIREKELKEHHAFMRTEEKIEAAKRRELEEKELKEHHALMRGYVRPYEPGPHLPPSFGSSAEKVEVDSRTSSYGCMRSAHSMDHLAYFNRAEEKREDPPAKRPEIRKLLGEHNALMWQIVSVGVRTSIFLLRLLFSVGVRTSHIILSFLTILFTMSGVEEKLRSLKRQSEALKRPESMMSMQRDRPMEIPPPVKLPDPPSMQIVSPLKPRPNIPRQIVSPYEPQPNIFRPIPEKRRAGSPASSSESMKSNRSMTLPVSVKRPASCESVKSDQSMGPPIAFKRVDLSDFILRQIVSPYEPRPNISSSLTIPFTMGGFEEDERAEEGTEDSLLKRWIMELQQRAGSPAPSCLSLKTDRSRTPPLNFRDEPGPSDTKDPGIDAGLWTQLNSMVSHLQEHISDCQNEMNTLKKFVRAINPEGQGEYEEGVTCERESAEKRQQRGIAEDHTGLPEKNESRGTGRLTTGQSSCCSGANVNPVTV